MLPISSKYYHSTMKFLRGKIAILSFSVFLEYPECREKFLSLFTSTMRTIFTRCVKDIFNRLEVDDVDERSIEGSIRWKSLGYISRIIAYRGWHRFESETLDIRLGLCPIPVPQSIYCLSWTCVTYSFRDIGFFIILQLVSSARSLFFPNLSKSISPRCNLCHFVPSFLRFVVP